jgi:hypothetical protein
MHRWVSLRASRIVSVVVLVLAGVVPFVPTTAQAAPLTEAIIRLDRMKVSTATTGVVCAKANTTAAEAKLVLTWPAGFTVASSGSWTVSTSNLPTDPVGGGAATAWPGIGAATVGVSSQVVTFTFSGTTGELTVGTFYCFNFTGGLTTPASTGSGSAYLATIETQTSAAATIDSTRVALAIVSNDQITITAVVPPLFSFALDANSDSFTLDLSPTAAVRTSGRTVTVGTNAPNGWTAWIKDSASSGSGLRSAIASYNINSVALGNQAINTAGGHPEQYGVYGRTTAATRCTSAIDAAYTPTGTWDAPTSMGGISTTLYQTFANCSGVIGPNTSDTDTFDIREAAIIKNSTPAASDYVSTITIIGAGNF